MKGFPHLNWKSIFRRFEIELECDANSFFLSYALRDIVLCFIDNNDIRLLRNSSNSKILFYQSFYERASYRKQFCDVQEIIESDLISYNQQQDSKIHIFTGLYLLLINLPCWFVQLWRMDVPISECPKYIHSLIQFYFISKRLQYLTNLDKYNLLVTFCDAIVEESFIAQLCKSKGIVTATLQHGAFSAWRENKLVNSGVELRSFNSDYLLCWNNLTIDEALKCNIPREKLVVVGILGYVKDQPKDWKCPHNNVFGIVIGHESFQEENLKLIEIANKIAECKGLNYYLKLHPNYDEHYFDSVVSPLYYKGNIKKGVPIGEYAAMVDFSLVGSSSVYIELVYILHDVIRYSSGKVTDKFKDVEQGKVIRHLEDVECMFDNSGDSNNTSNDEVFNYLCGFKNVAEEYKKFFSIYID